MTTTDRIQAASALTLNTPAGNSVDFHQFDGGAMIRGTLAEGGTLTVVATGGGSGTAEISVSGALGAVWDALLEVAGKLKGLLSCTPVTTTTVNVGSNGQITSVVTQTTCAPS